MVMGWAGRVAAAGTTVIFLAAGAVVAGLAPAGWVVVTVGGMTWSVLAPGPVTASGEPSRGKRSARPSGSGALVPSSVYFFSYSGSFCWRAAIFASAAAVSARSLASLAFSSAARTFRTGWPLM